MKEGAFALFTFFKYNAIAIDGNIHANTFIGGLQHRLRHTVSDHIVSPNEQIDRNRTLCIFNTANDLRKCCFTIDQQFPILSHFVTTCLSCCYYTISALFVKNAEALFPAHKESAVFQSWKTALSFAYFLTGNSFR